MWSVFNQGCLYIRMMEALTCQPERTAQTQRSAAIGNFEQVSDIAKGNNTEVSQLITPKNKRYLMLVSNKLPHICVCQKNKLFKHSYNNVTF